MSIYEINVKNTNGTEVSLSSYKNKVLLIVNTATGCGFTPQYKDLQKLYDKYEVKGFEILDFPCNQFGNQAPGSDSEINNFCELNYKTTFPRFKKCKVNGDEESPVFTFLKSQKKGVLNSKIKWNFTKFLVNGEGKVIKRYSPTIKIDDIEKDILPLLED